MKLFYSKTSPFARKIRIAADILELGPQLELVETDVFSENPSYRSINPLIKVPSLEMRPGEILVNSPFICQYLASLRPGSQLFPQAPELWQALNFQAVADGGTDAAVLRRLESLRPIDKQDSKFDQRQKAKIQNALEYFEMNLFRLSRQELQISEISVICFVDYLKFRFQHEKWDEKFQRLFAWAGDWNKKNSFLQETLP